MILWLLACAQGQDSLRFQETWEVLLLDADRSVMDVRFSRSNTGTLKGTPSVRAELGRRDQPTVRFGFDGWPGDFQAYEDGGVRIGPDKLRQASPTWELSLQEGAEIGDARDARLLLAGTGASTEPHALGEGWTGTVEELYADVHGFLRSGARDQLVSGRGVVLHHAGDGSPVLSGTDRTLVVVLADGLSIGAEQVGAHGMGWALIGDVAVDGDPLLTQVDDENWSIDFAPDYPLTVQVRARAQVIQSDPWEHLTKAELAALDVALGHPTRTVRTGRAAVEVEGRTVQASAVVVQVRYE